MPSGLTRNLLQVATAELCVRDAGLRSAVERFGVPPLWARRPGFATLLRIILEQQVSLASADALYRRLQRKTGRVTAHAVTALGIRGLRAIGFTRQKARYCFDLGLAVAERRLDLAPLSALDEEAVRRALLAVRGVGLWSADIYLLMALARPDVWPAGDLALAEAVRRLRGLPRRPSPDELRAIAAPWRPWRAVAARILWHFYLSSRRSVLAPKPPLRPETM